MAEAARVPDSLFWVEPAEVRGDRLRLGPEESRHLLRVFRASPGTPFEATDGAGTLYRCVLERGEAGLAEGRIEARAAEVGELPFAIHLVIGLPDVAQAEVTVEHAVALGAASIEFAETGRSGPERLTEPRLGRLRRIARAALKQSRRTRLPEMRSAGSIEAALEALDDSPQRFLADPLGSAWPSVGANLPQGPVSLAVGPPGGFLEREIALLEAAHFRRISLGPSRLTTSTATLVLLSLARNTMLHSRLP